MKKDNTATRPTKGSSSATSKTETKTVNPKCDIVTAMAGSAYKIWELAVAEHTDNSVSYGATIVDIILYPMSKAGKPETIVHADNGDGMSKETLENYYFDFNRNNPDQKGGSQFGVGAVQAVAYLQNDRSKVAFSVLTKHKETGTILSAGVCYEAGKPIVMNFTEMSELDWEHYVVNAYNLNWEDYKDGGTIVIVPNIVGERIPRNWANPGTKLVNPRGQAFFSKRYRTKLSNSSLTINYRKQSGQRGDFNISLEAAVFILGNHEKRSLPHGWDVATDGLYADSGYNDWDFKDFKTTVMGVPVIINIGKQLNSDFKNSGEFYDRNGDTVLHNLVTGTLSNGTNPSVHYTLESIIDFASTTYKASDREFGLTHLNGMIVTVDVPRNSTTITQNTKGGIDPIFDTAVKKTVSDYVENSQITSYQVRDLHESEAHKKLKTTLLDGSNVGSKAIREEIFGDGRRDASVLAKHLVHELGASKATIPDFQDVEGDVVNTVLEVKIKEVTTTELRQLSHYFVTSKCKNMVILGPSIKPDAEDELLIMNLKWETDGITFRFIPFSRIGFVWDK